MKNLLYRLFENSYLDRNEARDVLLNMARGQYNDSQIAAFITVFLMRSITLDELVGFREALLEMRVPVDLSDYDAIDIVGTGGDNKNTFNISTAACVVTAAAGFPVVKHGNYGATSVSGSSNVIEAHGVKFSREIDRLKRSLDGCNMAFLHAQFFNPALKAVAPVRKTLGVRTFFNILGPLVNPSIPHRQLLGVYSLKLGRLYNYLYQQTDTRYTIVNSLDGYDEISLTDDFKLFSNDGEQIVSPEALGFERCHDGDLYGGETVAEAAAIFDRVLDNTASEAQKNAVIANAAYAIRTFDTKRPIETCVALARETVESGRARATFRKFVTHPLAFQNSLHSPIPPKTDTHEYPRTDHRHKAQGNYLRTGSQKHGPDRSRSFRPNTAGRFVPESPARIPDRHYRRVQTQIAVERLYQTGSRYRRDHRKL